MNTNTNTNTNTNANTRHDTHDELYTRNGDGSSSRTGRRSDATNSIDNSSICILPDGTTGQQQQHTNTNTNGRDGTGLVIIIVEIVVYRTRRRYDGITTTQDDPIGYN